MTSPKKLESHTHKMKPLGSSKGSSNTILPPQRLFPRTWAHLFCPRGNLVQRSLDPLKNGDVCIVVLFA